MLECVENQIYTSCEREYFIYPRVSYCVCDDFFFAVMNGKASACQHLIAERLAEALSDYEKVKVKEKSARTVFDREFCRKNAEFYVKSVKDAGVTYLE